MAAKGKPKPMVLPQRAAAGTGKLMDNQDTVMKGDSRANTVIRKRVTFDTDDERARHLKSLAASNGMSIRNLMELEIGVFDNLLEANHDKTIIQIAEYLQGHPRLP